MEKITQLKVLRIYSKFIVILVFVHTVDQIYKEVLKKQSSTKTYNANYLADLQPETLLFISLSSSLGIPVFVSIRMRREGSVPCLRISTGAALWFSLCSEESWLLLSSCSETTSHLAANEGVRKH